MAETKIEYFADIAPFSWSQTERSLEIYIPVDPALTDADFHLPAGVVDITCLYIFVKVKEQPLADFKLWAKVEEGENATKWSVKDGFLTISLKKQKIATWLALVDLPITPELQDKIMGTQCVPFKHQISADFAEEIKQLQVKYDAAKDAFMKEHEEKTGVKELDILRADALFQRGLELYKNEEVEHSEQALKIFVDAANLGKTEACLIVADIIAPGIAMGLKQDEKFDTEKVLYYLKLAAFRDSDARSLRVLADMYENKPDIVAQSHETALIFAFYSALLGNVQAMDTIGSFYTRALGVSQDYAKARMWFEASVQRGGLWAAYNLFVFYRDGNGVEANAELALKYSKLSAAWSQSKTLIESADAYEKAIKNSDVQATAFHQDEDDDDQFFDFEEEEVLNDALQNFDFAKLQSGMPQQTNANDDEDGEELITPIAAAQSSAAASSSSSGAKPAVPNFDDIVNAIRGTSSSSKPAASSTPSVLLAKKPQASQAAPSSSSSSRGVITPFGNMGKPSENRSFVVETSDEDHATTPVDANSGKSAWWSAGEYAVAFGVLTSLGMAVYRHFK